MVFVQMLELLVTVLVVLFFITQVTIPLARGTVLFPLLRSREYALERERAQVLQALKDEETAAEIADLKAHRRGPHDEPDPDPAQHATEPDAPGRPARDHRSPGGGGL